MNEHHEILHTEHKATDFIYSQLLTVRAESVRINTVDNENRNYAHMFADTRKFSVFTFNDRSRLVILWACGTRIAFDADGDILAVWPHYRYHRRYYRQMQDGSYQHKFSEIAPWCKVRIGGSLTTALNAVARTEYLLADYAP